MYQTATLHRKEPAKFMANHMLEFRKNENLMLHEGWNYSIECQLGYYSIVNVGSLSVAAGSVCPSPVELNQSTVLSWHRVARAEPQKLQSVSIHCCQFCPQSTVILTLECGLTEVPVAWTWIICKKIRYRNTHTCPWVISANQLTNFRRSFWAKKLPYVLYIYFFQLIWPNKRTINYNNII